MIEQLSLGASDEARAARDRELDQEADDVATFLRAFPGRIFTAHNIAVALDVVVCRGPSRYPRLRARGIEISDGERPDRFWIPA